MKIKLNRARIGYEGKLKAPNFKLAESSAASAELIYRTFSEVFPISSANMQLKTGGALSEYGFGLILFSGSGLIEFKFDTYSATFENLSDERDVGIAVECIRLAEVVQLAMNGGGTSHVIASISAWYKCDAGAEAVSKQLQTFKPNALAIGSGFAGASDISFILDGVLSNPEERWAYNFAVEPSVNPHLGDLYLNLQGRHAEGGRYVSLDDRRKHVSYIESSILNAAGFDFEESEVQSEP